MPRPSIRDPIGRGGQGGVRGAALIAGGPLIDNRPQQRVIEANDAVVDRDKPGLLGGLKRRQAQPASAEGACDRPRVVLQAGGGEQQRRLRLVWQRDEPPRERALQAGAGQ